MYRFKDPRLRDRKMQGNIEMGFLIESHEKAKQIEEVMKEMVRMKVFGKQQWIKTLMKMFNMIGIGERAGSGILDIYQVWENEGWPMPIVEESNNPDMTHLTLKLKKVIKTSDIAEFIELRLARTRAISDLNYVKKVNEAGTNH